MRIQPQDFPSHLTKGLAPVYFIGGEEPLQRDEALFCLRAQAKKQGYTEREVIELQTQKDETTLQALLNMDSLFSEKRWIECRIKEGKNTKILQDLIPKILPKLPPHVLFVILYPDKLDFATLKTAWFTRFEQQIMTVLALPIPSYKFSAWIVERAKKLGLSFTQEALTFFVEHTEGNLIAANQALEKINLVYLSSPKASPQNLTLEVLQTFMSWESQYSVYDLVDALLQGAYTRTYRILESLKNEGTEVSLVNWAITKEVRNLISLTGAFEKTGEVTDSILDTFRVWKPRRTIVRRFLRQSSLSALYNILIQAKNVDIFIKTESTKKAWQALQDLCYHFCCLGATACQND